MYYNRLQRPTAAKVSSRNMSDALDLPPPYRAVVLREHRDAFAHGCAIAPESGAGTLIWVRRFDTLEVAVVLEPEAPLAQARCAHYAVLNAAADALAIHCPPEKPLAFIWPDTLVLDGGIIGGARLAWPAGADENAVPPWLVAGLVLRLVVPHGRVHEPGGHVLDVTHSRGTSLEIEGIEMIDAAELIGSFARHLMVQFDRWHESGFAEVARAFLSRLPREADVTHGIDLNGDLLLRPGIGASASGQPVRRCLRDGLREPRWLDPATGDPWL